MSRIGSVHWKKFERFVVYVGCTFKRESGDHRIYTRQGLKRPIVFPRDTSLPAFIILNNLRLLEVTREEYLAIIKKL